MWKPLFAFTATLILGLIFMVIGNYLFDKSELGILVSVCMMGALIIYFNEKKR